MYVAAQNAQAQSIHTQCGSAWNLFLMSSVLPASLQEVPYQLANMDSIYSNCIAALRLTSVVSAGYGQELVAFENSGTLVAIKQHGYRPTVNGVAGIQCIPHAIVSDILGLDEPSGYVNGLEDNGLDALSTTNLIGSKFIQFDLGTPCKISKLVFANSTNALFNPNNAAIEYFDTNTSDWVEAVASVSLRTYVAAGIDIPIADVEAQLWRIRFIENTSATASHIFRYKYIRFIASELPTNVFDRSTTDFTYAVLVPAFPAAATYKSADATQVPAFIFSVGGPLDGKVGVLNRRRCSISDSLSVLHLKLFGGVVQEIEDIV